MGLKNEHLWAAFDALAKVLGKKSTTEFARDAGFEPSFFNPSRRVQPNGEPRWPSTETIARALDYAKLDLTDFAALVDGERPAKPVKLPAIDSTKLTKAVFDENGLPELERNRRAWERVEVMMIFFSDPFMFVIEWADESCAPALHRGDSIIVSPRQTVRRNDRVMAYSEATGFKFGRFTQRNETHCFIEPMTGGEAEAVDPAWMSRIVSVAYP